MSRSSQPVDDRTPIAGPRLDIGARIGWLLRTHRTVAGLSLREMSAALRDRGVALSPASLSRIENEGQLSATALDGYATVLGLPAGSLRSQAEALSETFRHTLFPTPTEPVTLAQFSRTYQAVSSDVGTAGDWLEFARMHLGGSGFGLPGRLMEREIERLAFETARSLTGPRLSRRMAVTLLRRGPYAGVVADVARRLVADPSSQGHWDLMDTLSSSPTPDLIPWAGDLLSDPSTYNVLGATFLLQTLLLKGVLTLEDWFPMVPRLARAWEPVEGDPARRAALRELCHALPPQLRERVPEVCCPDPAYAPAPRRWSRDRRNPHYVYAESLATDTCARLGHAEEPLLARLLFESFFDPRGVRRANAQMLLVASPFSAHVAGLILERPDAAPDRTSWLEALRLAAFCHAGDPVPLDRLLGSADPVEVTHGLTLASRLDRPLDPEVVARGLAGDELVVRRTLYCLGMQGDDRRLEEIENDPTRAGWVRGGARWWRDRGGRLPR
ncbi:helix-turn-helix domain-containing protein [Nocardioides panaciterrulae]|uniref:Transcriptional regulator with XRE-family HTH domain n=1 Tax=Nocardioides panaciterrulae TaxID=661492 RepID=A0A7Y9E7T8_9ACTN|nr:helix-turn-helix transcriptional regulator [Nocardioides panaciterrulae]NYD42821.1 transcriptional regulator with XRE-family HTH domain [Nocardioides panaciterrulae]